MRIETKCYFDASKICLGKCSNSYAVKDYNGDYWASEVFLIEETYDPKGKTVQEIIRDNYLPPV